MDRKFWMLLALMPLACFTLLAGCSSDDDDDDDNGTVVVAPDARVTLGFLGRFNTGLYDSAGAEIPAFCPLTDRLFVINAGPSTVDVINLADPENSVLITTIDCTLYANTGAPNSVAVLNGILAIAIQDGTKTDPGVVVFFNTNETTFDTSTDLNVVTVGALPDMLTFTPDGSRVLVANEGEPNDDYTVDPEGSISIINIAGGVAGATVTTAGFTTFNAQKAALIAQGVRIFGPGSDTDGLATVAQDLEPEYITCTNTTAWVTLQEANAIAIVEIATSTVTSIRALGYKDHSLPRNAFDPSDRDGPGSTAMIQFVNGPIRGLYMPDAIASYSVGGNSYLVTVNEGDARDYGGTPGFSEEERLNGVTLDPTVFPNAAALQANAAFGRLQITTATGDTDNDGDLDAIYSFGGRSFSIWNANGQLVWDSGDEIERLIAAHLPLWFNAGHTNNTLDDRSDAKGPEPEAVTLALIDDRWYAFIGLERICGILVYDITVPSAPRFQTYINTRDFNATPGAAAGPGQPVPGLDLGPEGMVFVPAAQSPNGRALLIVSHEVSGSTTIYEVTKLFD